MQENPATTAPSARDRLGGIVYHLGLYIFMLVWSVIGLFFTHLDPRYSVLFWEATTIVFAVIAIGRVLAAGGTGRYRLALKQVAHWGAFLGSMLLLHARQVTEVLNDNSLAIVMLLLLALATFLDGLYVDWRFCVVGVLLGVGVLVVATLANAILVLLLLLVAAVGVLYFLRHLGRREPEPA
jgi:hypothetical protein